MNKTYKVIYNRTRCMYQVVSELAKGHTKSETPEMLKSLFSKHNGLTRGIVMAVLSMSLAMPMGVAVQAADTAGNTSGNTTSTSDTTTSNTSDTTVTVKDGAALVGSGAVSVSSSTDTTKNTTTITIAVPTDGKVEANNTELVTGGTVYTAVNAEQTAREAAVKSVTDKIGTLDANGNYIQKDASVSSNLSTLDTQVKTNAEAIDTNKNAISTNTSDITGLKNLSNVSDAGKTVIKEQAKQAVKVAAGDRVTVTPTGLETGDGTITYTVSANNNGAISSGDANLVSGGTMYTELRPDSTGTYYYISNANTTAANLIALDAALNKAIAAMDIDMSDSTTYTSKLSKYFKVNPEVTTSTDGKTKTYAPDAAANGTNSVAIGPSAQSGEKTTDATTSTTTVTGGTSSTAIGDSAVANGDKSVALGYNSQVLNASGSTTAVSGSTAIGNGAEVEGGSDSTALGTGATVDTASNAMALGTSATINKTATSGVAIGNGAVTGSSDTTKTVDNVTYNVKAAGGEDSVAIGTSASSAGNTSIALGKGASIENDTDGSYQAVVKSDDIAIGTGAKTSASDSSTAIGKGATVSQSTDAMAIGSSASVGASSNDAMALGKGAAVGSGAADSIAMGTSAKTISADTIAIGQSTSAEGANSVVIGKTATTTDEGGNAIGYDSAASGYSTAIGQSAKANNYNAVAIGNNATANADRSISLGYNAGVGTSEGKGETQNAGSLIAIGTSSGNNVSGMQNVAIGEGAGSNVKSNYNIAIGTQAGYGINYASDDKSQNGYNVSIGYQANYQENSANIMYSTALGNEANASNYAVAIGDKAKASGTHSLALGDAAQASDTESIALGHNTNAADGNVAIGNGSLAPAVSSLGTVKDGYVYKSTTTTDSSGTSTTTLTELKSAFTYKPLASDSHYISVGNSTLTRRISNVADGVFDSDAATVGQLNSLNELLQATDTKVGLTKEYFEQKFTDLNTTIDSSKTHYFSISESSDNLSGNKDNTGATSNKADAMAIGPNANATNVKSLAVGNNVYATGLRSIAIGTAPNPTTDAAGTTTTHNTSAEGENSIALGTSTTAQADNSVAIGTRAQAYTTDTTGNTGVSSVAIGNLATTAGNQSVALGYNATVKYNYGTAIGAEALASGVDAVAIGKGSKAYSTDSMAIGQDNTVIGNNVYGLGSSNSFSGEWGSIIQSGVSGYKNTITSVSDQDTTNALNGIYMTGNSNTFNQNVKYNVMQDITLQGNSNTIDGGAGGTSSHQNTLSQIAIVGSGNTVQGKSSDDGKTNNIKDVTILGYNNKVDANTDTTVDFSNTQILGNNVTAALGNSVYLGNNAAYVQPIAPAQDAIDAAKTAADTAAEASDEYKAATTDEDKATIKAEYEAKYLYKLRVQAMEAKGSTAGMNSYSTDETYGNGTSYTYAGSNPTGVVTVGSVNGERRIQNVAAGLVSATSTDAVNGSQLYALTRQLRFGGDNSSFGDTAAGDTNVVARGSNEKISITGGSDAVTSSTTDGTTTYTVDATKLTGNNIAVVANTDTNALHVQLASNLKDLNTASMGKTTTGTAADGSTTTSYQETLQLDGTGANGGTLALEDASGKNGVTLRTSGSTTTADVNGTATTRLLVNDKTVATTDDGLKFGGDTGTDSALKLNNKLIVKGGADTTKLTDNNIGVVSDGSGTLTVKLNKNVNLGTDGSLTTGAVTASTVTTGSSKLDTNGLTITNGPKFTSTGIDANNQKITNVIAGTDDKDAANYGQIKKATTTLTTGTKDNVTVTADNTATDGHTNYTIAVDNLRVKAATGDTSVALANGITFKNGTNTTSNVDANGNVTIDTKNLTLKANGGTPAAVTMDGGINFKNGKNTTAAVDAATGTVTIDATHNKLDSASYTASTPSDTSNQTTVKLKDTDGNETTLNLTDTYTTVSKNTDHTISFKRNDGSNPVSISLDDLNGASKEALTTAAAKATTQVIAGANVSSVDDTNVGNPDGPHVYKVNVSNLGVKVADGQKKSVALSDGLVFGNGTNTTASVGDNGAITFNVSDAAIKAQAKDAINMTAGSNVEVETATSTDGLSKTFTISATHNTLKSATLTKGANDVSTLTITGNDGDTASVDIKNTHLTVSKDSTAKTVTFTSNDGTTPATTLSLSDFGAASTTDMTAAVAKATTEVRAGANAFLGTVETDTTDQHKIYTVNVDNLGVSQNGTKVGTGVSLKNGLNFIDGTNTTASVKEDGTVSYSVSNDAIKAQAKDAVVVQAGDNVSIDTPTDANNVKIYTVKVNDLKLQANGEDKGTRKLAEGINFANGKNITAAVEDGKVVYSLNDALTDLTSVTAKDTTGNQTLVSGSGVTITPAAAGAQSISLTTNGLSMGNQQITNVASGGDTDTNAANISDVKRLVQASASGTAETGFNVKGDDADAKKVKLGKQLNVVGGTTDSTKLSDNNIGVVTTADEDGNATLTVKLNKAIALDSVTTGSSVLNTNGLTITGGPSVLKSGINAGNQKITGVLDGTDTTDAVNKGQLDELANTVNGGWTIQAGNATGNAQIVKPGDKVTLDAGNNLNLTQNGTAFTYSLAEDLTGLKSVMAVDAKDNQAVLTGEGLKVTDKEGNSLTQHTTEIRLHSSNADTADTSKDVVLDNSGLIVGNNIKFTNSGISAGNQKITGVADGELKEGSKEAVNGGQLYELKQQVGSGWKLTGDDTAQATNIGAGAQVSVKSGNFAKVTVNKSDSGATIQYDVQTQEITTNGGKAKTAKNGVATTQDVVDAINDSYWTVTSGQTGTGKATGTAVSNVTAGTAVTLQAGDNLLLNQAGNSFTYALNPVVTGMTSISFTGMGTGSDGKTVNDLVIGLQNGGGANPNKGYYITGLSNTEWNQSNYQGDRAATEAQLKKAIENVSIVKGGGGYGLTADEGANNGGDKNVTQALGSTIAVRGDGTYDENGKLVKAGNVKTVAYTDAAGSGQTGAIQIQLNKDINLGTDGSLQAGGVTLQNNSVTVGTDGVVISSSGTDRTVSNLSNTQWDTAKANQEASAGGYIGSTKAATESQLQQAISQVTTTAQNNEQHIQTGEYTIGKNLDGTDRTDTHSVSMDVVDGQGKKQGSVVIKDVAKASEVGDVSQLHDTLKNSDGTKNVTGAINNLDDRVTGLDNRMDQIYTTAGQHASVSAEDNIQVDSQSKNGTGGTDYKLSLNKEKIDLKNVTIEGNAGAVTAKTVTAEKYNVGDKTYISSDGINANSQKITNVQTGTADTDAANVGQMREADAQLADAIQQTDAGLNEVGRAVNKLGNRLNRVGAGAAALAALHPGTYDPNDKWDFSAGIGHYHDANAVAIGAYYHPNDTTILSIGGSMGGGENMVNAGITWKMGRSGREQAAQPVVVRKVEAAPVIQQAAPVRPAPVVTPTPVTTPAPVKSVASTTPVQAVPTVTTPMTQTTTGDTAALAQILARQTAILEKLAQNQSQAAPSAAVAHGDDIFPDVPDNHWAYAYVAKLEKAGALKGFKRPAVLKSPMMTRDDFASVLYTAMANGATTNPALNGDDSLNRLAQEFKAELKNVKV